MLKLSIKGFTLIEIMIAVAIIAMLATIALVVFTGQQQQARKTKVQQDFEAISRQIQIARQVQQNWTLVQITGLNGVPTVASNNLGWSDETCRVTSGAYSSSTKVMNRPSCITMIENNWSKITAKPYLEQQLPLDPWGSIYMFDENEQWDFIYGGTVYRCRWDMLISAGQDQLSWTSDDYYYLIPPIQCTTQEFPEQATIPGTRIF